MSDIPQILLFVENKNLLYIYQHLVERSGYSLQAFTFLLDIKKWILNHPPSSLIVTDALISKRLRTLLQQNEKWSQVPLLCVCTPGIDTQEFAPDAKLDIVKRPFKPEQFTQHIKTIVGRA
ncbi:MAG: hypothetical protein OEX00_10640 [Gammaproteobacteria bacterium]|nr:hypothetical protein [Gammaproteobacteria bacterium]MDH5692313.1 hypothetical protein [Gammaproteobacteria bacterium]